MIYRRINKATGRSECFFQYQSDWEELMTAENRIKRIAKNNKRLRDKLTQDYFDSLPLLDDERDYGPFLR
jgi:hypothetical protein